MTKPTLITLSTISFLKSGSDCRRTHGHATLRIVSDSYVMSGPSGSHSLDVASTTVDRLNAHWQAFASHTLNAIADDASVYRRCFEFFMVAAKVSLVKGDHADALVCARLALGNANKAGCSVRRRLCFRIMNWLRIAIARNAALTVQS